MKIVEYFDRTAIINLPERLDRRSETIEEFKRIDWPIGNSKINFFSATRPTEAAGFPSIGARGCLLSHLHAIKKAKDDKCANILILEDDISFLSNINSLTPEILKLLPQTNWGFLYLGHEYQSTLQPTEILVKISTPLPLTHCYAVNGLIFEKFIAFLEELQKREPGDPLGGPMHYDAAISTFRIQNPDINTYIVNPSLGYQRSSRTDLRELSYWDKSPLLSPFIAIMRKTKNILRKLSH